MKGFDMGYMEIYQLESFKILQDDLYARVGKLTSYLVSTQDAIKALSEFNVDDHKATLPTLQIKVSLQSAMEQLEWISDILNEARTIKRIINACRNEVDIHEDERKL